MFQIVPDPPPERLWHYTSGTAAQSIFENKALWAGHLAYMNDTSEFNHAMNLSLAVAEQMARQNPSQAASLARWRDYVTDSPPVSWAPNTFVVSFSEKADLLSQWRGYANGPGGPFSIGFPSELLQQRLVEPDGRTWLLERCIYDPGDQMALLEEEIRRGLVLAVDSESFDSSDESREETSFKYVRAMVMRVAPLCKHPDFREEQEWRLIFDTSIRDRRAVHFVGRQHTLAPYIEFSLADSEQTLDDVVWIAGPGPQQNRANGALGMVAQRARMQRYTGYVSETPYLP